MSRPGNKILQFASRSSERGKTERVGTVEGHGNRASACGTWQPVTQDVKNGRSEYRVSPDSLCSSSLIHAHKRNNGTFDNGPRFEVSETLAHAVFTVVFVVGLAASCAWFYHTFLEAETAIIHSISSKRGK